MSTSLIKTQASKGIAGMALLGRVLIKNTSRVAAGRAAFMRMYSARPASAAESARETTGK
ncbi:hypothetical protein GGI07_004416 [Coemansia sp. Benny D115]|nr:hypothetical protein GGI07_004416 [Coemansia sp. Benny D115]